MLNGTICLTLTAQAQIPEEIARQNVNAPGPLILDAKCDKDLIVQEAMVPSVSMLPTDGSHIKHLLRAGL